MTAAAQAVREPHIRPVGGVLERVFPDAAELEMFCRAPRPGWGCAGRRVWCRVTRWAVGPAGRRAVGPAGAPGRRNAGPQIA